LEVKIVVFAIFSLGANSRDILQFLNVARRKDILLQEALCNPLSEGGDGLLLLGFEGEGLAEVGERLEFTWICGALDEVSFGLV